MPSTLDAKWRNMTGQIPDSELMLRSFLTYSKRCVTSDRKDKLICNGRFATSSMDSIQFLQNWEPLQWEQGNWICVLMIQSNFVN